VHGEVAVVESGDTRIAYDLATGEELWRRSGGYLLATHDGVIAEVSDGRLSLLSPRTGAELWSVPSEEEWLSLTRWGDDIVVYQGSFGVVSTGDGSPLGAVAALDLATGRERWRRDLGATVTELARGEGQLVALVYKSVAPDEIAGGLVGLDPGTGRTRWDQGLEPNRWSVRFGTRMIQATGEADYAVLR
jgi:outer membrane protein assembly factor BamB